MRRSWGVGPVPNEIPQTRIKAYREWRDAGDDVSLRRRVAAALADQPRTTHELTEAFPEHSTNAIRPRVNELVRMECVRREGRRENPSGHEAYVHHLTDRGKAYLEKRITPEPGPTESELKTNVVDTAREVVRGNADRDVLQLAVEKHDSRKRQMDPEWSPP